MEGRNNKGKGLNSVLGELTLTEKLIKDELAFQAEHGEKMLLGCSKKQFTSGLQSYQHQDVHSRLTELRFRVNHELRNSTDYPYFAFAPCLCVQPPHHVLGQVCLLHSFVPRSN